jgi:hypothetical protein
MEFKGLNSGLCATVHSKYTAFRHMEEGKKILIVQLHMQAVCSVCGYLLRWTKASISTLMVLFRLSGSVEWRRRE